MFILEEYLYSLKMKFNNSVKRLRLERGINKFNNII